MKVLMFGWEFPPHISGGLGTACFGLTQALSKQNVETLFVVPKLYGDEPVNQTHLISASNVMLPSPEQSIISSATSYQEEHKKLKALQQRITFEQQQNMLYIEIQSGLSAYRSTYFKKESEHIEHWNYELAEAEKSLSYKTERTESFTSAIVTEKRSYRFSGSYGPNLIEETERYAEVAATLAKEFDFDIIHAHDWMTYPAGIAAKEVSSKPLVVHVHATEIDRSGDYPDQLIFAIEKYGMEMADTVFTVSQRTKDIVVDRYKIPAEKVVVVHNGIIPKQPAPSFTLPKLGSHVVTFLGRVTQQKGPHYFVEAARKVLAEFPDAHFIMAGSGDLLPQIIERVAQLRMSSRFHFTGFLKGEQIDKIWAMSDAYIMPSVSEPFGIAPLEAIQGGVPVILSNQSGVAEVMPHAIKVDFWDIEALSNAICGILKYKSLSDTLKKNSIEEIKIISWDNVAQKINRHYHELTAS